MKKATSKSSPSPMSLGTKRACPHCATKFYDLNRSDIICPKCSKKLDPDDLNPIAKIVAEPKKAKAKVVETEEEGGARDEGGVIEPVEDLGDEDEDLPEDLDVDDEEEQEY